MKRLKILPACICAVLCSTAVHAQLLIANVPFTTQKGAMVYVDGDVTYTGAGVQTIEHQGELQLTGNWYNTATTDLRVFTDASGGFVTMTGALQTFNGKNTRFPSLMLTGTDKKQQFTNIEIRDTLDLTNRELDVNNNTVTVLSTALTAIKLEDGAGYINTSAGNRGWLVRNVVAGSEYVYPLGHTGGIFRYRPLMVTAQQAGNIYGQFQDYNPSQDGYAPTFTDGSVSSVNPLWYHALMTDGNANTVHVRLPYNFVDDGDFTSMSNWGLTTNKWQLLPSNGPVLTAEFRTNDNVFNTTSPLAINMRTPQPLSLATKEKFLIPNVITPNGDGKNDFWVISGIDPAASIEVVIFNRWGNVVYRSNKYDNKWDGKGLNAGTYFYEVKIRGVAAGSERSYKGNILLMK